MDHDEDHRPRRGRPGRPGRADELYETQDRLRARHHALSTILSRRFNSLVSVPPEVAGVSVRDAALEIDEIDRQPPGLEWRIDAQHAVLKVADVGAQAA